MQTINNNPLYPALKELFKNLQVLGGLLFVLDKDIKQIIDNKNKIDYKYLLAGYCLVIRKLSESSEIGYKYYPTGNFVVKGQKYLDALNQLIERESAWAIAQGYERYKSFLYDIVSIFLASNDEFVKAEEKENYIQSCKEKLKLNKSQLNNKEWRLILESYYHGKLDILEKIKKWIPNFRNVILDNNRNINLFLWYCVLAKVRDAVTHSNLIIKNEILNNILQSHERKTILEEYFPGKKSNIGYELHINREKANLNLGIIGEFALEIFNNLSINANYYHDIKWEKLISNS